MKVVKMCNSKARIPAAIGILYREPFYVNVLGFVESKIESSEVAPKKSI